ncbi:hypothetical protein A2V82_09435 [candidate division KSB1 bacterium RBG_16_48_16]|nr:MAG: hypothetical protein A2V82_09435 [candidate division KSB1 bacterium RBG_16_48_16]
MINPIIKQTLLLLLLTFIVICIVGVLLYSNAYGKSSDDYLRELSQEEQKLAREAIEKYLGPDARPHYVKGDYKIDKNDLVSDDIVVVKGTIVIEGEVDGDVLVLFGDAELDSNATVDGDVIAIEGKIWTEKGAYISGDVVEESYGNSTATSRDEDERIERRQERQKHRKVDYGREDFEKNHEPFWFDYNRVDGITLGYRLPSQRWWNRNRHNFAIIGKLGYSFSSKRTQYQIGLERWIFEEFPFSLGIEFHDLTETEDRWIINDDENLLAALLIKEDFRDYYGKEGYSIFAKQQLNPYLSLKGEYRNDKFHNLEKKTNWSVFGKGKDFRENPLAIPYFPAAGENNQGFLGSRLELQTLAGTMTLDNRNDREDPTRGWYVKAFYERSGFELASDLDFERFILDVRRYQPLGWDENLDLRLRAGTSSGILPPMYWFDLGGLSTIRGSRFKELTGDHFLLANAEYRLRTRDGDWFILDGFDIILFLDAGYAWFENDYKAEDLMFLRPDYRSYKTPALFANGSFDNLTLDSLHSSAGIALATEDGDFRVNFAKRIDGMSRDLVVTVRLSRPF